MVDCSETGVPHNYSLLDRSAGNLSGVSARAVSTLLHGASSPAPTSAFPKEQTASYENAKYYLESASY